ncbi:hypothetical protein OK024_08995 [Acinetobacter sp. UGAL515B_02]|nr:hypothetical protein [Acinetobacter sp. UGAL515B_02]WON79113.1 hypothetical protein OK024_08995 [Acinetobacter sp. UGAL515B_02]
MNKVEKIYEKIKLNNENLQGKVHLFFHLIMTSDFEELTESRFTSVFLMKMFNAFIKGANLDMILSEIRNLERPDENKRRMKPATQFKHKPLEGLWHKHYEQVGISAMALNIKNQIKVSKSFFKDFDEVLNDPMLSLEEKASQLAYLSSGKQYLERIKSGNLTGEWIVYHIHKNKNYYLNICKHNDDDRIIAEEIKKIALFEFPSFKNEIDIFKIHEESEIDDGMEKQTD